MLGGIAIIIFVVLLIPVGVLMTGAVASAVLGEVLHREGKSRHEGSELLDIPD
jgi:FlaG/FlaF family flagellin (archaellin)